MKHGLCWRHATPARGCSMCFPVVRVLTLRELRAVVVRGGCGAFAQSFVLTWQTWRRVHRGSFVSFVREIDPGVPMTKTDYVRDATYCRCAYLLKVGLRK